MEVLIAQDSDQNNAAAAMHVKVGFMSDPIDFPGIAHFCEHMLFLGTKKYPTVGEFDKFLAANNGMSNAYTTMNATCFYFSVANQGFYEALDRFAQFFVMPLFNADYVQREVKAVDSEHKKNLENDPYRVFRLYCHSACPAHPLHKFNCGNYDTLMGNAEAMGVSLRDQLLDFYSRYYSSDIMKLSIVASQPLDTLTEWVASMFYPVVSKGQTVPIPSTIPFGPDEVAVAFRFKTVRKMYWTWITFPIPESKHLY
ncbi:metalloprotease, partial [Spiromyces aspiralis]